MGERVVRCARALCARVSGSVRRSSNPSPAACLFILGCAHASVPASPPLVALIESGDCASANQVAAGVARAWQEDRASLTPVAEEAAAFLAACWPTTPTAGSDQSANLFGNDTRRIQINTSVNTALKLLPTTPWCVANTSACSATQLGLNELRNYMCADQFPDGCVESKPEVQAWRTQVY